jgi:hypothetical protein
MRKNRTPPAVDEAIAEVGRDGEAALAAAVLALRDSVDRLACVFDAALDVVLEFRQPAGPSPGPLPARREF